MNAVSGPVDPVPRGEPKPIRPDEISIVLQGRVGPEDLGSVATAITELRRIVPGAEIIVSSWQGSMGLDGIGADTLVLSDDPGALPDIRPDGKLHNNINRQLVSTRAGLVAATRAFAVKLRADCCLEHTGFLGMYETWRGRALGRSPILACNLFTVDPRMFEQVPFHVGDWFQFGRRDDLIAYWSAPPMSVEDATFYRTHPFAAHSSFLDRNFRCRLAVEQYLAVHYADGLGYTVPAYHNDIRPEVLADHDRFLRERVIVAGFDQIGLVFPKYEAVRNSAFQQLNCLSHLDWLGLLRPQPPGVAPALAARRRRKRLARILYLMTQPLGPLLYSRAVRHIIKAALRPLGR